MGLGGSRTMPVLSCELIICSVRKEMGSLACETALSELNGQT